MDILFYERIAAAVCKTSPELLFVRTKKEEVVTARQFCMVFRNDRLKMPLGVAGGRYKRDHATVHHSKKVMKDWQDSRDTRWENYLFFCKECEKELLHFYEYNATNLSLNIIHEKIGKVGYKEFIEDASNIFHQLADFLVKDEFEGETKALLEAAHNKVLELKYLYE
jgi:hypothetical protein